MSLWFATSWSAFSQDWPQWRGPRRDGVTTGFQEPKTWPESLKKRWRVEVGTGHSSPVVSGSSIYLHSRQGENEVVTSLDLDSGRIRWQDRYAAPYKMDPAATGHGKGPKATPLIQSGRLYTFGVGGILSCYDAEQGRRLWQKEFSKQFKATSPLYGASASPLLDSGKLVLHVGGYNKGALTAFNPATGEVQWSWNGDGPGHASPIVVELEGVRQVVTQTQRFLVGVAVQTGELLWRVAFTTDYDQNTITPVVYEQMLLFSGFARGVLAIRLKKHGNQWVTEKVWENSKESMYMSSPVVSGSLLFGFSHSQKGHFNCLDLRTGTTRWASSGRQGENAAIVGAGHFLFLLTDDATLIVMRVDPDRYVPLRRYTVASSPTWAHPVVVRNIVLIKDLADLTAWSLE